MAVIRSQVTPISTHCPCLLLSFFLWTQPLFHSFKSISASPILPCLCLLWYFLYFLLPFYPQYKWHTRTRGHKKWNSSTIRCLLEETLSLQTSRRRWWRRARGEGSNAANRCGYKQIRREVLVHLCGARFALSFFSSLPSLPARYCVITWRGRERKKELEKNSQGSETMGINGLS